MKTVTVWIPTYNRVFQVKMALTSLLAQDTNDFNVYIYVDNTLDYKHNVYKKCASLIEALAMRDIEVVVHCSEENRGICAVKNEMLISTPTEWFLYMEDDSVFAGNYVSGLINFVKNKGKEVSGVGGVQQLFGHLPGEPGFTELHGDRINTFLTHGLWNDFEIKKDEVLFLNKAQMHFYYDRTTKADTGVINLKQRAYEAKCLIHTYMLRRSDVELVGGWDMDYNFPYYSFEEIDLTHKLYHIVKGKLFVLPYCEMYHLRTHKDRKPVNLEQAYKLHEKIFIDKWISK